MRGIFIVSWVLDTTVSLSATAMSILIVYTWNITNQMFLHRVSEKFGTSIKFLLLLQYVSGNIFRIRKMYWDFYLYIVCVIAEPIDI
jgi:hypothetical protein